MRELKGKVAVVTGAGSGIGRGLALQLAREGCQLAISDKNADTIEETRKQVEALSLGTKLHVQTLDVSDRAAFHAYADTVAQEFGKVNLVINNAGVALSAPVHTMTYEELEWLLGVNFWGVVHGTKAFLPHLMNTGDGHLVNISSIFGIFCVPTQAAYHMSKFAVRGLTETLRMELDVLDCGVSATCVHPGGIKTNIVRSSRMGSELGVFDRDFGEMINDFDGMARTTPDEAARVIIAGVKKNKRRVLIGNDAKVLDWIQRHFPTGYQKLAVMITQKRKGKK